MKKPWSITTTVRNPYRLRDFLIALQPLEGTVWDKNSQEAYQKLLIKNRLYGYGSNQFYNNLPHNIINSINNLDFVINDSMVNDIVHIKKYMDFDMRGRQSLNPLTKFGFVLIDNGKIKITNLGKKLIGSDGDLGDIFLRQFIKWQIPNLASKNFNDNDAFGIIPFVSMLMLIQEVNKLELKQGNKAKGISKSEFALFVPTLTEWENIRPYSEEIIKFRKLQEGLKATERKKARDAFRDSFLQGFIQSDIKDAIRKFISKLEDYGDNAIRYFRLTKFIRIRGGGYFIDTESSRLVEIEALIEGEFYKPRTFIDKKSYLDYMTNDKLPILPWQTFDKLNKIAKELIEEIQVIETRLNISQSEYVEPSPFSSDKFIEYIDNLRHQKKLLLEKDNRIKSQPIDFVKQCITNLDTIFEQENRAMNLEYFTTMGLFALNDALEIKPNYPVGDDNEPTSTAPGGVADIECYYNNFNMICEVTMLKSRDQWFNEGQPVMRHLRDFENKNQNALCIFIAPRIHTDTAETFFMANTYGYKKQKQKIAPLTIKQFIKILKVLQTFKEQGLPFRHQKLQTLIEEIVSCSTTITDSDIWIEKISDIIQNWGDGNT